MPKKEHWRLYSLYKGFDLAATTKDLLQKEVIMTKNSNSKMIDSTITCKKVLNDPSIKPRVISELPPDFKIANVLGMQLYDIIEQDKGWEVRNLGGGAGYLYIYVQ